MTFRVFGNEVTLDMPSELRVDVQGLQELYRLSDIDRYGKVAPNRLSTVLIVQDETPRDNPESASVIRK